MLNTQPHTDLNSAFRTVALGAQTTWRYFFVDLAKKLKQEHGSKIILYSSSPPLDRAMRALDKEGVIDVFRVLPPQYPPPDAPEPNFKEVSARARDFEVRYNMRVNQLAVPHRHLGRGFAPGGFNHPRSPLSERTSYGRMLQIFVDQLAYWEREIQENDISLVVNLKHRAGLAIADGLNVPVRNPFESRFKSYYFWASDERETTPEIRAAYERITNPRGEETIRGPAAGHANARSWLTRNTTLAGNFGYMIKATREHLYTEYKIRRGGEEFREGKYYLTSKFHMAWRNWRDAKKVTGKGTIKLADLGDTPFVFYPLHVEPELGAKSPENLVQLGAILALARDLPAGTVLAVKEHLGSIGRRPADFYRQIKEFKNVAFLDVFELGWEIVRTAAAVATIAGTAGLEAAVLGRPVISFGRHNTYGFLPHVFQVTDEGNITDVIDRALSPDFDHEKARRDGQRFLEGLVDASFSMGQHNHMTALGYGPQQVQDCYSCLARSVGEQAEAFRQAMHLAR